MSSEQRFFVAPSAIENGTVRFSREQAHQMAAVLRLAAGTQVVALDNSGWEYRVKLSRVGGGEAVGSVTARSLVNTEPRTKITLYVGLIRGPKLEVVLQKCTELGVVAFVPVVSQRCVVGQADELSPSRLDRWQRILVEAAEQSGRGKLPILHPAVPFDQACDGVRGLSLLLWEGESEASLRAALRSPTRGAFSLNLFVGPEGGFTPHEAERARAAGIAPVTLGPRILRAETASIAAVSAILFAQNDLG
ncbi:MAG TPA: RsmE family RNA methyltransferase [Chloroflexota bacterium]